MNSHGDAAYRRVADIAKSGQELLQSRHLAKNDMILLFLQWYEKVEVMIKDFLQAAGQTVNTVRDPVTGKHRYHEEILECLRNPKNPYYDVLGRGEAHECLRVAKLARNTFKSIYLQPYSTQNPNWDRLAECIERIGNAMWMALGVVMSEVKHHSSSDLRLDQQIQLMETKQRVRQCELELEQLSAQMENDKESLNERKGDKTAQAREDSQLRSYLDNLEFQSFEILFDHKCAYRYAVNTMENFIENRRKWLEGEANDAFEIADGLVADLSKFTELSAAATRKEASLDQEAKDLRDRMLQVESQRNKNRVHAILARYQLIKQYQALGRLRAADHRVKIKDIGPRVISLMKDYVLDIGKQFLTAGPQSDKLRKALMEIEGNLVDLDEESFTHLSWAQCLLIWMNAIIKAVVS